MSEKNQMKELVTLMRDTFIGEIHVDKAVRRFNEFIESTEDFEHENRIYALEGKIKEIIEKVNFIALYYESKGDYAGAMEEFIK